MRKPFLLLLATIFLLSTASGYASTVYADKELENNTVLYELPTTSDEDVLMFIEYTDKTPYSEIVNVRLSLDEPKEDGEHAYILNASRNWKLKVIFTYKGGEIWSARVDSDYFPDEELAKKEKTFTVRSKKGHKINFEFHWKRGEIEFIKIFPKINPYEL